MTQKSAYPTAHPNMGDSSQKQGTWSAACRQHNRLESILSSWLSWSEPQPSSSTVFGFFSSQLDWSLLLGGSLAEDCFFQVAGTV